jgi:hypothetical protein
MKNILERISILNRVSGSNINVEIHDLYDTDGNAAGTKVILSIPETINDKKNYDTHSYYR